MPFFSKVFRHKDDGSSTKGKKTPEPTNGHPIVPAKPRYASTWESTEVVPEEVEELIHACTLEMKSRAEALDTPFVLLPFRPDHDQSSSRSFIRNYFRFNREGSHDYRSAALQKELRLTEPEALCSIVKWCWSRIPDGVVSWRVYDMFRMGEQESSHTARNTFDTFVPLGVDETRKNIIYDFFDLLSAIAARAKVNGLGGRQLSRMAGWWAFTSEDTGKGFDGGYRAWAEAADASSHLFFAYLRSRAPEAVDGITGISALPRSLQALIAQTEYPPDTPALMQTSTYKVVMIVDAVSSTPFALLRRAKHFEFRDDDHVLREFSSHSDPVSALTEECRRVLESISSANQSMAARSRRANLAGARLPSGLPNPEDDSWYRFQDQGFSSFEPANTVQSSVTPPAMQSPGLGSLQSAAQSKQNFGGRPTTPSWADFLNSGFADDGSDKTPQILLPPGKQLPPFGLDRSESMFSLDDSDDLEPGELASISQFELDDSFWWVWMTSLASEEPPNRKGAFGRCALIETLIPGGRWLVMEEQVKGAAPSPEIGAYIAEKKSRFGFSKRSRSTRRNRTIKEHVSSEPFGSPVPAVPNKRSITAEEVTLIKAAAARLNQEQSFPPNLLGEPNVRRGRYDDAASTKTNSVMTLGITKEAGPAMKWANSYDKEAVRKQYLGDNFAGKGFGRDDASSRYSMFTTDNELKPIVSAKSTERELPPTPFTGTGTEPERVAGNNEEVLPAPLPPKRSEYVPEVVEAQTSHAAQVHSPVATPYEEHFVPAEAPVEVPLPDPSPYEETTLPQVQEQSPRSTYTGSPASQKVGREPLPQEPDQPAVHPAFRNQDIHDDTTGPVQEASAAAMGARAAWKAQQKPSSPPKAAKKKHGATAGLIKMFNRKKEDVHRRPAPEVATSKKTLQAPSEVSLGRRLSLMRRKDPKPTEEQTPEPQVQEVRSNGGQSNAFEPQVMAESLNVEGESRPTTQHLEEAHEEFSKFDQGPITDAPAFAPRSSVDTDVSRDFDGPSVPRYRPDETEQEPRHEAVEHTSPSTMDESFSAKDPVSPVVDSESPTLAYSNDRWAQIRRNAAERAARGSEDTSLQSHDQSNLTERTDEGETSGEETIEDRVARIKARVAVLTGNLEDKRVSK